MEETIDKRIKKIQNPSLVKRISRSCGFSDANKDSLFKDCIEDYLRLANQYFHRNKIEDASRIYRKCGLLYLELKEYTSAGNMYQSAGDYNLALSCYITDSRRSNHSIITCLEKMIELDPKNESLIDQVINYLSYSSHNKYRLAIFIMKKAKITLYRHDFTRALELMSECQTTYDHRLKEELSEYNTLANLCIDHRYVPSLSTLERPGHIHFFCRAISDTDDIDFLFLENYIESYIKDPDDRMIYMYILNNIRSDILDIC